MAITNNVSSIQAHQTLLNNNAHNVANVNTERYVPNEGVITGGANGSVNASISAEPDSSAAQSQTNLSEELTEQAIVERAVEANVVSIRTQDEMYGSLLDIKV